MSQGDKSKYTGKQVRKAEHIEQSYEERGAPEAEAERRAWATVNKDDGGGKKPGGSGCGATTGHPASRRGGKIGGKIGGEASAARPAADKSSDARKAAETRRKKA